MLVCIKVTLLVKAAITQRLHLNRILCSSLNFIYVVNTNTFFEKKQCRSGEKTNL